MFTAFLYCKMLLEVVNNFWSDIASFFDPEELIAFLRWLFLGESPDARRERISREGSSVDPQPPLPTLNDVLQAESRASLSCMSCFDKSCELEGIGAKGEANGDAAPGDISPMPKAIICTETLSQQFTSGTGEETTAALVKEYTDIVVEKKDSDREASGDAPNENSKQEALLSSDAPSGDPVEPEVKSDTGKQCDISVAESTQSPSEDNTGKQSIAKNTQPPSEGKQSDIAESIQPPSEESTGKHSDIAVAVAESTQPPSEDSTHYSLSSTSSGTQCKEVSLGTDTPSQKPSAVTASKTGNSKVESTQDVTASAADVTSNERDTVTIIHPKKKKKKCGAKKTQTAKSATHQEDRGGTHGPTPVSVYSGQQYNASGISKEDMCPLYELCPQLAPGAKIKMHPSSVRPPRVKGKVAFNSPLLSEKDFNFRISQDKVCLEFIQLDTSEPKIHGYIRVLNTAYAKEVTVVSTIEKESNWKIVCSGQAEWVESVEDGTMDRFKFTIAGIESVGKVSFVVKFNSEVDDNKGEKYTVVYDQV